MADKKNGIVSFVVAPLLVIAIILLIARFCALVTPAFNEPNEPRIVFEITDTPAPEAIMTFTGNGHNICLGEGAGLELTDESYQFIVNVCGDMLQTTMTPEEFQTIYDVVTRAVKEVLK